MYEDGRKKISISSKDFEGRPPKKVLKTFTDSDDTQHIVRTDQLAVKDNFAKIPINQQMISIPGERTRVPILVNPAFRDVVDLEPILSKQGIIVLMDVVVESSWYQSGGTQPIRLVFRSRNPIITLLVHGQYTDGNHHIDGGIPSERYYLGVSDYLLKNKIQPPQLFVSCDTAEYARDASMVTTKRFDETGKYSVLGFPGVINEVAVDQGRLYVFDASTRMTTRTNTLSVFANPMLYPEHVVRQVQELFYSTGETTFFDTVVEQLHQLRQGKGIYFNRNVRTVHEDWWPDSWKQQR